MRFLKSLAVAAFWMQITASMLNAQSQIGLRIDNYAGIQGGMLNPAANALSPISWDVFLGGGQAFVANNYFYFEEAAVGDVIGASEIIMRPEHQGTFVPAGAVFANYRETYKDKFGAAHVAILGPGAMVTLPSGLSVGFSTAFRSVVSIRKFPSNYSYYENQGIKYDSVFNVNKTKLGVGAWSEFALSGSYAFETGDGFASFGANLKFLGGYEGAYINLESDAKFKKREPDTLRVYGSAAVRAGLTTGLITSSGQEIGKNGSGNAIDFGFMMTGGVDEGAYKWKFGASLLDLGTLRFDQNSQQHYFEIGAQDSITFFEGDYVQYTGVSALDDVTRQASYNVYADSSASYVGKAFRLVLPSRLVLQGDYAVTKNVYVSALWSQRISQWFSGDKTGLLTAENLIAFTPRYERRWVSVSLPIELYDYTRPRIGIAARIGILTIGSDQIGSWLIPGALSGTDFYAGVRIYPFWPKREKAGNFGRRRSSGDGKAYRIPRGRPQGCPKW